MPSCPNTSSRVFVERGRSRQSKIARRKSTHGEGMVGFLLNQFFGIRDGSMEVFGVYIVIAANLVESHFFSLSTGDTGHRHTRSANHGVTVLDFQIYRIEIEQIPDLRTHVAQRLRAFVFISRQGTHRFALLQEQFCDRAPYSANAPRRLPFTASYAKGSRLDKTVGRYSATVG